MKKLRHCFFYFTILAVWGMTQIAHAQQSTYLNEPTTSRSSSNFNSSPMSTSSTTPANLASGTGANSQMRIGIVNTKKCLENSKLGKQEQSNIEKMKQQMESVLQEKEKILEDVESRLNDDDYMDSISDDAASELKRQRRTVRNEGMQLQSQYMQTLQQANLKIIQRLTDSISKSSAQVAQDPNNLLDIIFTDEACTYFSPRLDVTDLVVAKMNLLFDSEQKESNSKSR